MKRLFAIFLLSIHLFYTGGYNLVFRYLIHQSETQIVKQIFDDKVSANQLIQIKLPVHMPDIQDWPDYEKLQGQLQLKDRYYNYLGVKLTRDTMYLVCVANSVKSHLENANLIVAKDLADVPLSKKGTEAPSVKKLAGPSEYNIPVVAFTFNHFYETIKGSENPFLSKLTHPYIESPGKPPNHSC